MFKLEEKKENYVQHISTDASKNERMNVLVSGMNALSRCETISSVIDEGVKTAKLITDADVAYLLLLNQQKSGFKDPPGSSRERALPWSVQKKLALKVLDSDRTIAVSDLQDTDALPFQRLANETIRQVGCMPLINGKDKAVGVLQIANFSKKESFGEEIIALAEIFARHIGFVVESIEQANKLETKLKEDELLMTEIHHRLKNNLSTVTSLIEVDIPEISDQQAVDILQKTSSRIKSITQVHSLLYQLGTKKNINLGDYFRKLTQKITHTLSQEIETVKITVEAEALELDADRAMTCGLILNELIFNAYKHAFVPMKEGEIKIVLSEDRDGMIEIVVSDNGKGIGNNFAIDRDKSMGCWVIKALADRLDASIDIDSNNGTRYALRFAR